MRRLKLLTLILALALAVTALPACGPQETPVEETAPTEAPAPTEEPEAEEPAEAEEEEEAPEAGEARNIGIVLHFRSPFTDKIARGAEQAANDLGYEVEVVGPPTFDAEAEIGMFNALIEKGVDAIAVIAHPAATWIEPINAAIEAGVPVLTMNVHSPESNSPAWFGQDEYGSGEILAREVLSLIEADSGQIVLGTCAPGAGVLIDRADGFNAVMADYPEYEVLGPFDVGAEAAQNYDAWQNQLSAHPDALAMVGLCSLDMPNLTKLRANTGADFVAAGYDLEAETLVGIQEGLGELTVGQNPYLQGYLPVLAFYRYFEQGTPLPQGWVDVGTEVVNPDNVEEMIAREDSDEATHEHYAQIIDEQYSDMNAIVKPLPGAE